MKKTINLRGTKTDIDTQFENELGVYGDGFWAMVEDNLYEPQTFDFVKKWFVPGAAFIDVGAATGCMTIYAAQLGYQVVGIEPQTKVFEAFRRNLDLNPEVAIKVEAVHALVVDKNNQDARNVSDFFSEGASGPLSRLEMDVKLIDLETIISKIELISPVVLKMDIEGVEFNILQNVELLGLLKTRKASMYVSLHPGFLNPLKSRNIFKKFLWRLRAIREVGNLVSRLLQFAQVYNSTKTEKLNTFTVLLELRRNSRDFQIIFG